MKSKAYCIIMSIIECLILFTLPTIVTIMAWNLQIAPLFVFGIILYGISFLMITTWGMAMKCALIKTLKIFKEDK